MGKVERVHLDWEWALPISNDQPDTINVLQKAKGKGHYCRCQEGYVVKDEGID